MIQGNAEIVNNYHALEFLRGIQSAKRYWNNRSITFRHGRSSGHSDQISPRHCQYSNIHQLNQARDISFSLSCNYMRPSISCNYMRSQNFIEASEVDILYTETTKAWDIPGKAKSSSLFTFCNTCTYKHNNGHPSSYDGSTHKQEILQFRKPLPKS